MGTVIDRPMEIMLRYIALLDDGGLDHADVSEIFAALAVAVPNLKIKEIVAAADCAKGLGRRLRGLAHRLDAELAKNNCRPTRAHTAARAREGT
jgi:hypothetical protein